MPAPAVQMQTFNYAKRVRPGESPGRARYYIVRYKQQMLSADYRPTYAPFSITIAFGLLETVPSFAHVMLAPVRPSNVMDVN